MERSRRSVLDIGFLNLAYDRARMVTTRLLVGNDIRNYEFQNPCGGERVSETPLPVANFGHILAVGGDVLAMLHQFARQPLFQSNSAAPRLGQAIDGVHNEVKSVEIVQDRHIESGGDGS